MSYKLVVRPEVETDIADAESWHEGKEPGLGLDFTRVVRDEIRGLAGNPLIFRVRHRRSAIRWCYPPRFPHRIVYPVQGEDIVVKISDDFQFAARMDDRRILGKGKSKRVTLSWDAMIAGEKDQEMHRNFPITKSPPKRKAV